VGPAEPQRLGEHALLREQKPCVRSAALGSPVLRW